MAAEKEIWVILEAEGKKINRHSIALLKEGDRIARAVSGKLHALFVGPPIENLVQEAGSHGVSHFHACIDERLGVYHPLGYEQAMLTLLDNRCPYLLLALTSSIGSDVMPRLSYNLGAPLVTNCLDIDAGSQGEFRFIKPVQKKRLNARIRCKDEAGKMATVLPESLVISDKPGSYKLTPEMTQAAMVLEDGPWPMTPIDFQRADHRTIDIAEADVIVALGRGLGSKENFEMVTLFADRIGAAVAGTRPVVDMGILPHERQIGQTGKRVSPKIIFLFGISGAPEFAKGIEGAGTTVAINIDRHAPVFKMADVGIVGDVAEVTPKILKHIGDRSPSEVAEAFNGSK